MATSSGFILQICLIMALLLCCKCCGFVLVNGQVSMAWSRVLRTQELYTWPRVMSERRWNVRTGSSWYLKYRFLIFASLLTFFQAIFSPVLTASSQPAPAECMSPRQFDSLRKTYKLEMITGHQFSHPGSRRMLPPPAYQVRPELHSATCTIILRLLCQPL